MEGKKFKRNEAQCQSRETFQHGKDIPLIEDGNMNGEEISPRIKCL